MSEVEILDVDNNTKTTIGNRIPWWVKSIVLVAFTFVVCYKIFETPLNFTFDFPSFLALLLALFSVGLAALFYFKTTESSHAFYDNTYKFTQDIAKLLAKIESGFGEKLRHLDESYKVMQDRVYSQPSNNQLLKTEEEAAKEEEELRKIVEEKDALIQELMTKAEMSEDEKSSFVSALKKKDSDLYNTTRELEQLRRRLKKAESFQELNRLGINELDMIFHQIRNFIHPSNLKHMSRNELNRYMMDILPNLGDTKRMLMRYGFVDQQDELTDTGYEALNIWLSREQ
ncbi:TMF family protein [Calditrichota bacterium]